MMMTTTTTLAARARMTTTTTTTTSCERARGRLAILAKRVNERTPTSARATATLTNPLMPEYTAYQRTLIEAGRKRLLASWNAAPFKTVDTPSFSVVHDDEEIAEGGYAIDVFRARHAPRALSAAWQTDMASKRFSVEHMDGEFHVLVPHTYYLNDRYCCMSVDRACVAAIVTASVLATALVAAAPIVAGKASVLALLLGDGSS
jgi:hypothetical protein